ncbi:MULTISPECIES: hypothetical protein [unclassified Schaalia]|uniref:hypothetical protein n=1 Tax=unclassified Schaalia TaxID=2691889 RepID=UPI001E5CB10F|nr:MULTISPECIES: hypothetical protein [unclassified Schaalia]MCD4548843.1 hypothetical protein [Schaalia sp. lx-260]MCD4557459.1 hypothetical protein [Schaalia sp. lx-100]
MFLFVFTTRHTQPHRTGKDRMNLIYLQENTDNTSQQLADYSATHKDKSRSLTRKTIN